MTSHKIYYVKMDDTSEIFRDNNFFPEDHSYSFHACPVWSHRSNRTFTIKSKKEYTVFVDPHTKTIDSDIDDPEKNFYIDNIDDINCDHPVIQITFPKIFFWTESKDIWIEAFDHPLTSYSNNFISIGGWWNLSNYPRGISFPIQLVDPNKVVSVNVGDPLLRVRFYSKNFDDGFVLVERENNKESINLSNEAGELTKEIRSNKSKLMNTLFKGSCPFKFLHTND